MGHGSTATPMTYRSNAVELSGVEANGAGTLSRYAKWSRRLSRVPLEHVGVEGEDSFGLDRTPRAPPSSSGG